MHEEYVSIHHRIRISQRQKLKVISAVIGKPVTDIMNEAIDLWLSAYDQGGEKSPSSSPHSTLAAFAILKEAKAAGNFLDQSVGLPKSTLVDVGKHMGLDVSLRSAGDHLRSAILAKI